MIFREMRRAYGNSPLSTMRCKVLRLKPVKTTTASTRHSSTWRPVFGTAERWAGLRPRGMRWPLRRTRGVCQDFYLGKRGGRHPPPLSWRYLGRQRAKQNADKAGVNLAGIHLLLAAEHIRVVVTERGPETGACQLQEDYNLFRLSMQENDECKNSLSRRTRTAGHKGSAGATCGRR